ncbi:glycine dehydrogenase [bacterium SM23_31]|nr:MAG: glycine dehydrogenase [bacterium SM23_31]
MPFIPNSDEDRRQMLQALGVTRINDLISSIPQGYLVEEDWNKYPGKSEHAAYAFLSGIAGTNRADFTCFLGGGAYDHFIPAAVDQISCRSEFVTAYTPYQPEVSQGTLQSIYEYQTMICELTGMDVSNASMYDGVSATAEAVLLAAHYLNRSKILIAENLPVNYQQVLGTYCHGRKIEIEKVPCPEGAVDVEALKSRMDENTAGLVLQYPNYYGIVESLTGLVDIVHSKGGLVITSANPIALALLRTPGECGVDIVTGEGQVLGNEMNWGGPYLGIFALTSKLLRKIPGRLVGRTVDSRGRQGFVLTLQTREQHIRREKATSNICTNQGLVALRACIYMSLLGKQGVKEVAGQCLQKAHYLAWKIAALPGFALKYDRPFFHEFVIKCPESAKKIFQKMYEYKIFAGIPLDDMGDSDAILIAVTEKRTKEEMDNFIDKIKKFSHIR